jgi:hypothetical protein
MIAGIFLGQYWFQYPVGRSTRELPSMAQIKHVKPWPPELKNSLLDVGTSKSESKPWVR